MNTNSDFRLTPCAGENVRVAGAIRLPASVRRRGIDLTIGLACALFLSLKAEGGRRSGARWNVHLQEERWRIR